MDGSYVRIRGQEASMRTALVIIATGERYYKFIEPLIKSVREYFVPVDIFLWTDRLIDDYKERPDFITIIEGRGYPNETLHRYHTILTREEELSKYDQIFYCDIDMLFVAPVGDIFSDGITATIHPGYIGEERIKKATPERRPISTAYCPELKMYYCGGFNGGSASHYLAMAREIRKNIDIDTSRGITAIWHDESHLNRYLHDHAPAKILSPAYCYPEDYVEAWEKKQDYGWHPKDYPVILIALDKAKHDNNS